MQPPPPLENDLRSRWLFDPAITCLNHGSFGGIPREVFDAQTKLRLKIESDPVEFIARRSFDLINAAKIPVGKFLRIRPEDFGFITNATEGVNTVLQSLRLNPGDEILTTTHVYNAVRQAINNVCQRSGAVYRQIDLPLPIASAAQIEQTILQSLTPKTRLLVIDHITSPTAIVFPVDRIIAGCAAQNVDVLIDGAHAPGMLDLDIPALNPAYYVGNFHKWVCAPKGSAFLWVRPDRQQNIHPLIVSRFFQSGFVNEFNWQGTRDFSAWLTVPVALDFLAQFDWKKVLAHNHAMATWANQFLCQAWNVQSITPLDGSLLGSMATIPVPFENMPTSQWRSLQQIMHDQYKIEVPLETWPTHRLLRISAHIYNTPADYQRLADVILQIKG